MELQSNDIIQCLNKMKTTEHVLDLEFESEDRTKNEFDRNYLGKLKECIDCSRVSMQRNKMIKLSKMKKDRVSMQWKSHETEMNVMESNEAEK
uniref:Uncharacterized protein n=1 Tax=Megaselia scalaris TaxID=36166 RepID=T1GDV2_MEGSC